MLNIKRIFETIADAGQKILEKKSIKSIAKKRDLLDLCDDLLSTKGAAFGITLARDILFRYQNLSLEDKNKFLIQVNDKYKPDAVKIDEAIKSAIPMGEKIHKISIANDVIMNNIYNECNYIELDMLLTR